MPNVGIVIVSHSPKIAEGAADMVRQMVGDSVNLAYTGGDPGGGLGTGVASIREAIDLVTKDIDGGDSGFHLSFDMDAVDPSEAPGVGTPVRGGMTYREAHLAMETICDSGRMTSMEIVEVNPVIDEVNRTALLGVELVMSAMGKRIL